MQFGKSISFGYDFEGVVITRMSTPERTSTQISLDIIKKIVDTHTAKKSNFTLFVLGKMAEESIVSEYLSALSKNNQYVDIQQHTYSHALFKKHIIKEEPVSLEKMDEEIRIANEVIENLTGKKPIGIRVATGFYKGFQGEKERLRILRKNNMKFISSDLRGVNDQFPAPWKNEAGDYRQPYFYKNEGFPEILEIPTQGNIDVILKGISRLTKSKPLPLKEELYYYLKNIDFSDENDLNYAMIFHPWAIAYNDKDLLILNKILNYALRKKIPILSYKDIYEVLK